MLGFKLRLFASIIVVLSGLGVALAQTPPTQPPGLDLDLSQFWERYTSGEGLAYVVVKDGKGERVYRYGDVSRLAAKKYPQGFVLFTCMSPHVFIPEDLSDKADLLNARVVKSVEPGFAELDAKYLSGCRNPFVKSALPNEKK